MIPFTQRLLQCLNDAIFTLMKVGFLVLMMSFPAGHSSVESMRDSGEGVWGVRVTPVWAHLVPSHHTPGPPPPSLPPSLPTSRGSHHVGDASSLMPERQCERLSVPWEGGFHARRGSLIDAVRLWAVSSRHKGAGVSIILLASDYEWFSLIPSNLQSLIIIQDCLHWDRLPRSARSNHCGSKLPCWFGDFTSDRERPLRVALTIWLSDYLKYLDNWMPGRDGRNIIAAVETLTGWPFTNPPPVWLARTERPP